ncbi:MAG: Gfo/Idh/MocA family oxidoreductase [Candidatus Eremiobacteraeota bacterium]|nr:Gfo/Idh/MocA family oxidoreductase [Candidatus Eremiobacteraeota bacterium]MBV8366676.1 Gfo/Idh/MocA family oxidoreductase [Candidatus Eremiobacteraeota bacterium]
MNVNGRASLNVALVGYGYWGPNVARNFSQIDGARISYICDLDDDRRARARQSFPYAVVTRDIEQLLADQSVDLVAIATPVSTHHPLAMRALTAGKHILVEKPLANSTKAALEICAFARHQKLRVFVDHTFVFTPAVRKMKEIYLSGELGTALYYDSTRVNLGIFQHDVNVIWDLVTHDLAILDYLLDGRKPRSASCTGMAHLGNRHADLAYLTLRYDHDFIAHINVNWLAPMKVRQVLLCGDRRMLVYDDNSASEKIKIYDSGVSIRQVEELYETLVQYRLGDMYAPRLETTEALTLEARNIIDALHGHDALVCDGDAGARVVSILEAANYSLRLNGQPVELESVEHQAAG